MPFGKCLSLLPSAFSKSSGRWFNNPTTTLSPFFSNAEGKHAFHCYQLLVSFQLHFNSTFILFYCTSYSISLLKFYLFFFNLFIIIYTRFYFVSSNCIDSVVYVGSFCLFIFRNKIRSYFYRMNLGCTCICWVEHTRIWLYYHVSIILCFSWSNTRICCCCYLAYAKFAS